MDKCGTRKSSYKLRKIGKFNYSLTIPPTIVEYLGGYSENKELSLECKDGKVIISPYTTNNDVEFNGWKMEFNSLMPFIKSNNIILGCDLTMHSYFCYINFQQYYGNLEECISLISAQNIEVPKVLISALKKYVKEN